MSKSRAFTRCVFLFFSAMVVLFSQAGCKTTGPSGSSVKTAEDLGNFGDKCSDGVFGTPNRPCRSDLTCYHAASSAPTGPAGSSSARMGECRFPGKQLGETCAVGVFGAPSMPCAKNFTCEYPEPTATATPSNRPSSGRPGKCVDRVQTLFECKENSSAGEDTLRFYLDTTQGKESFGVRDGTNLGVLKLKKAVISRARCFGCYSVSFSMSDDDVADFSLVTRMEGMPEPFKNLTAKLSETGQQDAISMVCENIHGLPK